MEPCDGDSAILSRVFTSCWVEYQLGKLNAGLFQEGNLRDAKKKLMAEVKSNPQNYNYLGQIAERQGQLEEALECYRQAAALRADDG